MISVHETYTKVPAETVFIITPTKALDSVNNMPSMIPIVVDMENIVNGHQAYFSVRPERLIELPKVIELASLCKQIEMPK